MKRIAFVVFQAQPTTVLGAPESFQGADACLHWIVVEILDLEVYNLRADSVLCTSGDREFENLRGAATGKQHAHINLVSCDSQDRMVLHGVAVEVCRQDLAVPGDVRSRGGQNFERL